MYNTDRTLEIVEPVPFLRTKYSTRKMCFELKAQTNVPANNCHLKVHFWSTKR